MRRPHQSPRRGLNVVMLRGWVCGPSGISTRRDMCTLPNTAIQCCCGQHRAAVLGPAVPAETVPTQRNPHLQCIADHECMGCRKVPRLHQHASVEGAIPKHGSMSS